MKCQNCGYISSREFYRCPYCGHIHEEEGDILKTRLTFGGGFSIQVRTILYGMVFNLFALSVMVDWFLNFKYSITLWSFIGCFGILSLISIIFMKRKLLISIVERIDIYLLVCLILGCALCKIDGVFDLRTYVIGFALPGFLIASTLFSIVLLFDKRASSLRPLVTALLLFLHAIIATVLFIFLMVNKYCVEGGMENPPFAFLQFGMTKGNMTPLYIVEQLLIFGAFGLSWAYLINYVIILVSFIFRKVKNIYGGSRD